MASGSLFAKIEAVARANCDAIAFQSVDGTTTTYGDLLSRVNAMAGALRDQGVAPDDRVMVQVEKSIANVALYLATLKVGAVYNPLNTAYTPNELSYFANDAKPKVLVIDPDKIDALAPVATAAGIACVWTLDAAGRGSLADAAASTVPLTDTISRAPKDLAALLYTSGTTGRSKGAMITHENLLSNAQTLVDYWGFEGGDTLLHALPIFHVHGLFVALNTAFLSASRMIWMPKFDAEAVAAALPKATVMMGVPTFYTRLLATEAFTKETCANMRLFVAGSAPLLAETHDAFAARTGHRILERYGMTEAGMITSNPYRDGARLAGTVGFALPGINVRIADDTGRRVEPGAVGVLEVKGPNVFTGYWQMPDKTAEEFRDDGYFVSGDMATMGSDGRVTIVGRSKDLIISGGYNIYPKEIEEELNAIQSVGESAVIGVPHPDFGEGVVAVVTSHDAARPPTEQDIKLALEGQLANFKRPKRIIVVEALPRNAMGKVQKAALRETYGDCLTR